MENNMPRLRVDHVGGVQVGQALGHPNISHALVLVDE